MTAQPIFDESWKCNPRTTGREGKREDREREKERREKEKGEEKKKSELEETRGNSESWARGGNLGKCMVLYGEVLGLFAECRADAGTGQNFEVLDSGGWSRGHTGKLKCKRLTM
jgi:hypothetical protein